MWNEDLDNHLKVLHKLTHDHIALTTFSTMCVLYATQVLSNTMATVLKQFGTPYFQEISS